MLLFHPPAVMLLFHPPALIAEVILYSEGFESSKNLAQKMTQMYKLCSEQLSQQDHYDFGMRAVKSVLVMAGSLKRQNPDKHEDVVLIRALRDSNLPKFLQQDALLFQVSGITCRWRPLSGAVEWDQVSHCSSSEWDHGCGGPILQLYWS